MKYYLSIAAIIKDEGINLKEWIEYHLSKGVEHFYLYDNRSTDNTLEILNDFKNVVTYKYWDYPPPCQLPALNDTLSITDSKWVAFVDPDEFIVCEGQLSDLLKEYEEFGGLGINWLIYGSNGHDRRPVGGILENYTRHSEYDFPANLHIKTICQPARVEAIDHPHFFKYKDGFYCVTENKEVVDSPFTKFYSGNKIRLNHYYCKSREDFELKQKRGRCDIIGDYDFSQFNAHDLNQILDNIILNEI